MADQVIVASRRRAAVLIALGLAVSSLGSWLTVDAKDSEGRITGWVMLVLFGLWTVVQIIRAVRPSKLTLRSETLTLEPAFGRRLELRWRDVDSFFVWRGDGLPQIAYRLRAKQQGAAGMALDKSIGMSGALGGGWSMKGQALVDLLEARRAELAA